MKPSPQVSTEYPRIDSLAKRELAGYYPEHGDVGSAVLFLSCHVSSVLASVSTSSLLVTLSLRTFLRTIESVYRQGPFPATAAPTLSAGDGHFGTRQGWPEGCWARPLVETEQGQSAVLSRVVTHLTCLSGESGFLEQSVSRRQNHGTVRGGSAT